MGVALIVAAGSGERLGANRPKAFVELAGRPLITWSIDALASVPAIERIVLALPPAEQPPPRASAPIELIAVEGGASRSESVRLALAAAGAPPGPTDTGGTDFVLVHDAARPLVTVELIGAVIAALACDPRADAAIAAAPITDTVKRVDRELAVRETLDRGELWAVQTPQVFRRSALERALDVPVEQLARATDDAWLVERAGGRVIVVPAGEENLKITRPLDLHVAELVLLARDSATGAATGTSPQRA